MIFFGEKYSMTVFNFYFCSGRALLNLYTSAGWFEVFWFSRSVVVQLASIRCYSFPENGASLMLGGILSEQCPILNQLSVYKIDRSFSKLWGLCTCNVPSSCNFNPSLIYVRGITLTVVKGFPYSFLQIKLSHSYPIFKVIFRSTSGRYSMLHFAS